MLSIWQHSVTLQTFADNDSARGYPEIIHGTLEELDHWAERRNAHGFGVYVTVNETDGKGRKVENIVGVRAYYTDIDGLPTEEQKNAKAYDLLMSPLPPSAMVKTKGGLHCYWYVREGEPVDAEMFKQTVKGLAHHFGGDERASDISRVLRLPGYRHLKNSSDPYPVEVIWEDAGLLYSGEELRSAYPLPQPTRTPPTPAKAREYVRGVSADDDWGRVLEALAAWHAPTGQKHTVLMQVLGVALKFGVPQQRAVADLIPIVASWDVRDDPAASVRTRAEWAYTHGQPTTVAGLRNAGVMVPKLSKPESV